MQKHVYKTKIRYAEVDLMGYVHNSNYQIFFEEARIDMVRARNYPYSKIEEDGIILPISEIKIQFFKPLYYDEDISVEVGVDYIKNMSIKITYSIIKSDGSVSCTGYTIHAFIDKNTKDFIEVPEKIRNILKDCLNK
jgi:acyl-CoA thioester hydrolase